jgi:hypothetical protein
MDRVDHGTRSTSRAGWGRVISEMPTNRSDASASSRRRSAAGAGALIVLAALTLFVTVCSNQPEKSEVFVMDDFESGALTEWQAVGAGSGGRGPEPDTRTASKMLETPTETAG